MLKKFLITLGAFAVVVLTLGAVKVAQIKQMSSVSHVPPPAAVTTAEAKPMEWHSYLKAIGTLAPVEGATLSADADGIVSRIVADSGTAVKAGDLLVELDASVEIAQLNAAQAQADLARLNYERAKDLWAQKSNSKSDLDLADATLKQSVANAAALQAQIAKKQVRAPFDGRVGIRLVNVGQFVPRGKDMVPLQKLDPIFVNFNVPQQQLAYLSVGQKVSVGIDAFDGKAFEGAISAINSEVDASTRNISVQARLANPEEKLRAGMFAQVEVELPAGAPRIAVPATAINYAPYGNSVFIVEKMKGPDGAEYLGVRQQFVKLGDTRGDLITIDEGVKPGEQIVIAGVFKLRNGMAVQVNNTYQPTSDPAPKPANT
jgi:membrane fusion protein (multidrug efflux system)